MKAIEAEFKYIPKMPPVAITREVTAAEFIKIVRSKDNPEVIATEIELPRLGSKTFGKFIVHYRLPKVNESFSNTKWQKVS